MLLNKVWSMSSRTHMGLSRLWRRCYQFQVEVSWTWPLKLGNSSFRSCRRGFWGLFRFSSHASFEKDVSCSCQISGVGGCMMSKQGLKSLFPMEDIAVMGIWELLPHIYKFRVKLKENCGGCSPVSASCCCDGGLQGVLFSSSKALRGQWGNAFAARYGQHQLNDPLHFHYVAPSFWAWKGGEARLRNLAAFVDHVLCILPNEEGKEVTPCGLKIEGNSEDFKNKYAVPSGATIITLLPGSRLQEVTRMLPIFAKTIERLKDSFPKLLTVIHVAPNQHLENYITRVTDKWPVPAIVASTVALCTSGTVAVELQLARLPCVVAYRAHFLTEWFIRELMHNESFREEQILPAEKVIRLLYPSEIIINDLEQQDVRWKFPEYTPSMMAASTITRLCEAITINVSDVAIAKAALHL
ncbi:hypothetical protein JRO89_XS01G0000100 [Xanthoceras sorbifolium]|uniref:lipid-A-disaccharide synthase n=1 Tax=Xanthoceras sorbifolium TaxID=99658 RepID=A0ABQ8IHP8_9ROSI|nr:hypothetical protein JRO89_XS01G0000100 [Xanthoceras sorbifolium]